jgi:hypothetical protein
MLENENEPIHEQTTYFSGVKIKEYAMGTTCSKAGVKKITYLCKHLPKYLKERNVMRAVSTDRRAADVKEMACEGVV